MSTVVAKQKVPKPKVVMLELIDKKGSGFFLEGTQDTPYAQELNAPLYAGIPETGYRAIMQKDERTGEEIMVYEEIRYISGQQEIRVAEQDLRKIRPNRKVDKISFVKGFATIAREGSNIGLYDYLTQVFYCEDAPFRSPNADVRFRIIDLNKQAEVLLEDDEMLERAISITNSLKTKTGNKEQPYEFNEEKIEALAELFQIQSDNIATKVYALSKLAKINPTAFVEKAETFEQKMLTELNHAIQLKVIAWDKNTAILTENKSVITEFGSAKLSKEQQVSRLADFLKTPEGSDSLQQIRILVDAAKQRNLE